MPKPRREGQVACGAYVPLHRDQPSAGNNGLHFAGTGGDGPGKAASHAGNM